MDEKFRETIRLQTFYSPSLFWFNYEKDIQEKINLFEKIQNRIVRLHICENPNIGQIVAVRHDGDWHRAEVRHIQHTNENRLITVLLVDEGMCLRIERTFELPPELRSIPPFAYKGVLYGLVSTKTNYDFVNKKVLNESMETWSIGAMERIREILDKDGTVFRFGKRLPVKDMGNCLAGDIFITQPGGEEYSLSDFLIKEKVASFNETEFKMKLLETGQDIDIKLVLREECALKLSKSTKTINIDEKPKSILKNKKNRNESRTETSLDSLKAETTYHQLNVNYEREKFKHLSDSEDDDRVYKKFDHRQKHPNVSDTDSSSSQNYRRSSFQKYKKTQDLSDESDTDDKMKRARSRATNIDRRWSDNVKSGNVFNENNQKPFNSRWSNDNKPVKSKGYASEEQVNVSNLTKQMYPTYGEKNIKSDSLGKSSKGRGFSKNLNRLSDSDSFDSSSLQSMDEDVKASSLKKTLIKLKNQSQRDKSDELNVFKSDLKSLNVSFYPAGYQNLIKARKQTKQDKSLPRNLYDDDESRRTRRPRDKSVPRNYEKRMFEKKKTTETTSSFEDFLPVSKLGNDSKVYRDELRKPEMRQSKSDNSLFKMMKLLGEEEISKNEPYVNEKPVAPCIRMEVAAGKCFCVTCTSWIDTNEPFGKDFEENSVRNNRKNETKIERPALLLKPDFKDSDTIKIMMKKRSFQNLVEKFTSPKVLVQSSTNTIPVRSISEAPLHPSVFRAMQQIGIRNINRIQAYSWTSVAHCENTVIVNGPNSRKKMSYLPAICSNMLSLREPGLVDDRMGAYVVILVPGVKIGDDVANIVCRLYEFAKNKPKIVVATPPLTSRVENVIVKGVDILITTPKTLIKLLEKKQTKLKRVCHLVLQGADLLLCNFPKEVEMVLNVLQNVLSRRKFAITIQTIMVSRTWTPQIERLVKRLTIFPVICIGSYIEAALYGRTDISVRVSSLKDKIRIVEELISDSYKTKKTVIVCTTINELNEICKYLEKFTLVRIDEKTSLEQQNDVQTQWKSKEKGSYLLLIGTDQIFKTSVPLNITDAEMVVMYSLPDTVTDFTKRFSLLLDNVVGPFIEYENEKVTKPQMLFFLDEYCSDQFTRICNLLARFDTQLNTQVWKIRSEIFEKKELEKSNNNVQFCRNFKLLGYCEKIDVCPQRHFVYLDDVSKNDRIPQSGIIKIRILHVHDVTHYSARLIEHIDADGETHVVRDKFVEIATKLAKLTNEGNRMPIYDVEIGTVCCIEESQNLFRRCEVIKIVSNGVSNLPERVEVKLMDVGSTMIEFVYKLYSIEDSLKTIPPQSVEVCLSELGPLDGDTHWSYSCRMHVLKILTESGYENADCYFSGRIRLQINNCLWVDNLILREYSPSGSIEAFKFSASKTLLDNGLVESRPKHLEALYHLFQKENIPLPNYDLPVIQPKTEDIPPQITPNWAHLENCQEFNMVYFCSADSFQQFFVRICKHQTLFDRMIDEIQTTLKRPHYPSRFPIIEGRCYLLKDNQSDTYGRVILKKLQGNSALCFFVDYGDYMTVDKSELKFITDELISILPFQVIECELYGIEWCNVDALYDLAFENDSDLLRFLHVKVVGKKFPSVTNGRKYSVLLIDTTEKNVVNEEFVKKGFANKITEVVFEEIDYEKLVPKNVVQQSDDDDDDDTTKVEPTTVSENVKIPDDDNDDDNDCLFDENMNPQDLEFIDLIKDAFQKKYPNFNYGNSRDFDVSINDHQEFWKAGLKKDDHNPLISRDTTRIVPSTPLALPSSEYHTPTVEWFQTDEHVTLKIKLPGVESFNLSVARNRFFKFNTVYNEKYYQLNFILYSKVMLEKKEAKGFYVYVLLKKLEASEWERLVATRDRMKNIIYDPEKIRNKKVVEEKVEIPFLFDVQDKPKFVYEYGSDYDYNESDVESVKSNDS